MSRRVRGPNADRRFCPRCGCGGPGRGRVESALCGECGERLEPQGYCAVCEECWTLAPGTPCPKHELVLEPPAAEDALPGTGPTAEKWVTVGSFADSLRAEAPRIRLEAEGIPTFVDGARMGSPSMYQVATGGVKLQVPASLASEARILLSQTWSNASVDEDLELDDAWDELGPDPGARWRDCGRVLVFLVLFAPLLLSLLALGLAYLGRR